MSTCCIALGEPAQIRGSISKKKWTVIRQNMRSLKLLCIHAHVQRDRKTDRNISVHMRRPTD